VTVDPEQLAEHYATVVRGFKQGWVVPILGAGANRAGRPAGAQWTFGEPYLPDGAELAAYLAEDFDEYDGDRRDLIRVSQYISVLGGGTGPLYKTLHPVFDRDYTITPIHEFLAHVPGALREAGKLPLPPPKEGGYPLVLTTNYDDLLERAFDAVREPYELCVYVADAKTENERGRFRHREPDGTFRTLTEPESELDISLDKCTVILKIHGFVDRDRTRSKPEDSYVITEDHYIDYLTRTDLAQLLPPKLLTRLTECHFLFLGYSMRDWNLRAMLQRLWSERAESWDSWAIQLAPPTLERKSWELRGVQILEIDLDTYLAGLRERLAASLATAAARP
jgi:hypothetical protein